MVAFADVLRDADVPSLDAITGWLHELARCDTATNREWCLFNHLVTRLPHWLFRLVARLPLLVPRLWVRHRGSAVLISSPARYGVDVVATSWAWPLGISFGLVKDRPVVREGQVVACPTFVLTLNFDRRILAGAQAAHFFQRIVEILEHAVTELTPELPSDRISSEKVETTHPVTCSTLAEDSKTRAVVTTQAQ
jgi:hypothetical protein